LEEWEPYRTDSRAAPGLEGPRDRIEIVERSGFAPSAKDLHILQ
jgi:hypothetical protein